MPAFLAHKFVLSPKKPVWWSGVLLSLGVGALLYFITARSIEHDAGQRFKHQARNTQYAIASRIKAYTDVLRGAASFVQATEQVSRSKFHHYVAGLDLQQHFPAIDNINYAQYLTEAQRADFERAMDDPAELARDGYPPLHITPPGRRADYSVITMLEPVQPFAEKFGLDIAAREHVASVLARARDSNTLSASGQPIDILSKPRQSGLAMRLPVYRNALPLHNVAQRRAAYLGTVGIGFSVHRLVQGALDEMPVRDVRLSLYDGGKSSDPILRQAEPGDLLLFDSLPRGVRPLAENQLFSIVLPLDFNGRAWKARFSAPKSDWYTSFDAYLPWLALLTGFAGTLLIYALFHTLSSSRLRAIKMAKAMTQELRDSQAKLQMSHHKLRRLAAHADQIKEQERKRIAREIHDDLGQNLLVLRIEADMLASRTRLRHPRLHARARLTLSQIDTTIKSVRHIINDLRPTVLDLGLAAAVEWQIAQFRQRSGMVCELHGHQHDIAINDHCATAFFRVLQESLSNILQHAKASLVRVELRQQHGMLSMTISDNGVGIRANSRNKIGSFGLVGIEERISILGGQCAISGSANAGTTVTVSVPIEHQAPAGFGVDDANAVADDVAA
ncbi:CHASE domain-containing protein [Rugamonas sp. CCM 8940]|uniref:CHASE domain-containing protein n=1 Tax=Rugamonas sp. CCM 8940 TaxID=2765359 RepID=UPI0018F59ED3|nr:CHASE domain-containing protein [Rugamonas sp. CCM 8940]MBJ7311812.1 CHASE domain-containing protein [Rugamonas sp. CCM 8940]